MGSSSSRHAADATERRDRGDYPAARRDSSAGGLNFTGALDRCTSESQPRRESQRRIRSGLRSARQPEVPAFIPLASTSSGSGTLKNSSSSGELTSLENPAVDQLASTVSASEGSSSRTAPTTHYGAQVEITRALESAGASAVLVVEAFPSEVSETPSAGIVEGGHARNTGGLDSHNLWLEGHPPWNSRFSSPLGSSASETPSLIGQNLQAVCETTLQQHRVNEMQERLRRYAGFPPSSFDYYDLERRGMLSAESSGAQDHRTESNLETGDASSSVSGSERDEFPFRTPASLQAWEITEEGRLIEYRRSVYTNSESWGDRHLAFHRSELHSGSTERSSTPPGPSSNPISTAGRESRRNGGRRLWDALTRAASHRRTSTPMTAPTSESVIESWMQNEDDHIDFGGFQSRSLDLEERRRRVRSQVWALQLLSNGLEGMPGFTRPCVSGGHHHGHCSCDVHGGAGEDTSTRASISRIIMLAEALFEVLDEIHRQSIALSRTSVPIASLPAPDTVVNAIPTRKISKKLREEATQCNICLVEYEEGDNVRVLPCHHEYHVACVDKWLKEVHRVCPLCRGNVCEANSVAL
ncbi:hypothetical protein MPTK1_1g06550 [Marchantia polymorpha subsp. ruderalis]|uniref:RING-type domain-containing protein n=2 Tax=Marchantia polymorpha TaxID=3197 RepID=A0AAF6AM86_MARPO|nr:hypothetical protein MARPO_0043s0048 [Marchantia polymorpha]BBM97556.1 hypothetical protein Mp_1g06550 [Marchantia polymorpha subsp. ruderalis]|eukprot:PTQ39799.1 hypothetical protein MARPO_0043s0048 [Marchantia polymorpha]